MIYEVRTYTLRTGAVAEFEDRFAKRQPLRAIIQSQARHLAVFLRGERSAYEPFVASW